MRKDGMAALMNPASVAIVGDSPTSGRGRTVREHLLEFGYRGDIFPINPKYPTIGGLKAYPSLSALPTDVDFVTVAVGAEHAVSVLEEAAGKHARAVLYVGSGFADAGSEGRALQSEVTRLATKHGIRLCGPNCYGIANFNEDFVAYSGPIARPLVRGNTALLFQSGALTHSVTDPSVLRGIGYSVIVTAGNEANTTITDYLDYIVEDPNTTVVGMFVEGIRDLAHFRETGVRAIARGKSLVLLKGGRSRLGREAAFAHTAAIAGEPALYDALCDQLGIARVGDIDELIETCELLSHGLRLKPGKVAFLSISGGSCSIASDLAGPVGFDLQPFSPSLAKALAAPLPYFATPRNPLDLTGAAYTARDTVPQVLDVLASAPEISAVVYGLNSPVVVAGEPSHYLSTVESMAESQKRTGKPHIVYSISSGPYDPALCAGAREAGIPCLQGMREALVALRELQRLSRGPSARSGPPTPRRGGRGRETVARARSLLQSRPLSVSQCYQLVSDVGVVVPRHGVATTIEQAEAVADEVGYPVVLKVDSPDIVHKTEIGGVVIGIADRGRLRTAYHEVLDRALAARPEAELRGVVVEEMVDQSGMEAVIGIKNYPGVGPLVTFGLGGVWVELYRDVASALGPLDRRSARKLVRSIRGRDLLAGYRGFAAVDVEAAIQLLVTSSHLAHDLEGVLSELEFNPVRLLPKGNGVRVLDVLAVPVSTAHTRAARQATAGPGGGGGDGIP